MNTTGDFNKQSGEQIDTMIIDVNDDLEMASLEERISFLYEVIGVILIRAIQLAEQEVNDQQKADLADICF